MNELYIGKIYSVSKTTVHKLYAWLLAAYFAFASLSSQGHILLFGILCLFTMVWLFFDSFNFKKCKYAIFYVIFCAMSIMSLLFTSAITDSLIFMAGAIAFFGVYVFVSNTSADFAAYFMKCIFIVMSVFAALTFVQAFAPDVVDKICSIVLDDNALEQNRHFVNEGSVYGGLPGITSQTGVNAFYMAVFAGMCLIRLLAKRKKRLVYAVLMMVGIFDLIKTNKRGMLIFFCMMAVLLILVHNRKHIVKAICVCVVAGCVGIVVLLTTDFGKSLIEKFTVGGLSGRETLWRNAWNEFLMNPVFGIGIDSYAAKYGMDAHNIYLQVLCETGIVGFVAFMTFVASNFIFALKICFKNNLNGNIKMLAYFSLLMQGLFLLWGLSGNTLYDQMVLCSYMIAIGVSNSIYLMLRRIAQDENRNIDVCQNK